MLIKKWDPFKEFERFFDDLRRTSEQNPRGEMTFLPAVNISHGPEKAEVEIEIPGIPKKDIDIQLENGVLTISGEKKVAENKEGQNYLLREQRYGRFQRSFQVPDSYDVDKIGARYDNGVLFITLPKKEESVPKKLKIDIG